MTGTLPLPRPRTARQVHVGEHVHLGPPRAADRHQPELDRRRRAGALIDGFAAMGVRQTVIGPASPDVSAGPAAPQGTRRVVQRRRAALPLVAQVSVNGGLVRHAVGGVVHVHLHEPVVLPPPALLALARVGPVVVHLGASAIAPLRDGSPATLGSRLLGAPSDRWLLRRADLVVTASDRLAELATGNGARAVVVVPNAPPPAPTDLPGEPARPWPSRHGRRIVSLGPLVPRRRTTALIDALAGLPDDVEVVAIGTGPDRLAIDRAVRRHRLGDRVHVVPTANRAQVAAHLAHAEVVVSAGLTGDDTPELLTAMAGGCPVVATSVEGVPRHLAHDIDGLLVPPADTPALAAAIGRLLDDPTTARTLGASARRRVSATGWTGVAVQVLEAMDTAGLPASVTSTGAGSASSIRTNSSGASPPIHAPIAP